MPESTTMSLVGVMDVGGSHAKAAVLDATGPRPVLLASASDALDSHAGRDDLLGALLAPMWRLHRPGMPWNVAMPGPFDYPNGRGDFAGVGKFESIAGVELRTVFSEALAVDGPDIRFLNDAEAFAIGEWAADGVRAERFVGITLGTGVGSAFLDRGRAVREGDEVPPNGWAHLIRVDDEPLEHRVSTAAIRAAYETATGRTLTVREIAGAATDGDHQAGAVFGGAMRTLGRALAPWLRAFGTDELVVGGAIARSWNLVEPALRAGFADAGFADAGGAGAPSLRPSLLGEDAPLFGAAEWTRLTAFRD